MIQRIFNKYFAIKTIYLHYNLKDWELVMLKFILRVNGCKAKCMKTSPGIKMCTWAARLRLSDHFEDWTSLQDWQMFSSQRSKRGPPSSKWPESSVSSQKCSELQVKFIISIQLVNILKKVILLAAAWIFLKEYFVKKEKRYSGSRQWLPARALPHPGRTHLVNIWYLPQSCYCYC